MKCTTFLALATLGAVSASSAAGVCDCSVVGCATNCPSFSPKAFCGASAFPGAQFNDGSGCSCDWGYTWTGTACTSGPTPPPVPTPPPTAPPTAPPTPPTPPPTPKPTPAFDYKCSTDGAGCASCPDGSHGPCKDPSVGWPGTCGPYPFAPHKCAGSAVDCCPGKPTPPPTPPKPTPAPPTPPPTPPPVPPPPLPSNCTSHTVGAGDNCERAAGSMRTTVGGTTWWDGNAYVACPAGLLNVSDVLRGCPVDGYPPSPTCNFYVVQPGDSCASVADAFKVPLSSVTEGGEECPINAGQELYAGDVLLICPNATASA